jgi:GNAT superfamily N-acetyltransferase
MPARGSAFIRRGSWLARLRRLCFVETWVLVRRELSKPLPTGAAPPADDIEFRRASHADLELWRDELPEKMASYRERLAHDNPFATIGVHDGKLVSMCWFAAGGYHDPALGYTFRSGPSSVYIFEAWVSPRWRDKHVATQHLEWACMRELPRLGYTNAMSYFASTNTSARKLHAHFGYELVAHVLRLRFLGKQFFVKF